MWFLCISNVFLGYFGNSLARGWGGIVAPPSELQGGGNGTRAPLLVSSPGYIRLYIIV